MKPARSTLAVAISCFSIAVLAASAVAQAGDLFTVSGLKSFFESMRCVDEWQFEVNRRFSPT